MRASFFVAAGGLITCALLACSGNRAESRAGVPCELSPADSVYLSAGPVYRECHVDERAALEPRSGTIEMRAIPPPRAGTTRCLEAEVELVVGTNGFPENGTWRLIRSNEPAFGDAVLAAVAGWRYKPAKLGGAPVRQIIRERRNAAIATSVVRAGEMPAPRSRPRC